MLLSIHAHISTVNVNQISILIMCINHRNVSHKYASFLHIMRIDIWFTFTVLMCAWILSNIKELNH